MASTDAVTSLRLKLAGSSAIGLTDRQEEKGETLCLSSVPGRSITIEKHASKALRWAPWAALSGSSPPAMAPESQPQAGVELIALAEKLALSGKEIVAGCVTQPGFPTP